MGLHWMWDFLCKYRYISIYAVYIIILLKHLIINIVARKNLYDKCRFYLDQFFKMFKNTYISVKNFLLNINFTCLENDNINDKEEQPFKEIQDHFEQFLVEYVFLFFKSQLWFVSRVWACYVCFNLFCYIGGITSTVYLIS